jgi:hypothetical protein
MPTKGSAPFGGKVVPNPPSGARYYEALRASATARLIALRRLWLMEAQSPRGKNTTHSVTRPSHLRSSHVPRPNRLRNFILHHLSRAPARNLHHLASISIGSYVLGVQSPIWPIGGD